MGAIPEVVSDGETGFLCPPGDIDAMANSLANLLSDRVLRLYMGQIAEDHLETNFSVERMVDDTVAIYQKVL